MLFLSAAIASMVVVLSTLRAPLSDLAASLHFFSNSFISLHTLHSPVFIEARGSLSSSDQRDDIEKLVVLLAFLLAENTR